LQQRRCKEAEIGIGRFPPQAVEKSPRVAVRMNSRPLFFRREGMGPVTMNIQ
jgi:hypothetical protein